MKFTLAAAIVIGGILAASADQAIITSTPQNLTINAGSTADFVVTASGTTSYQWAFDGTNIAGATGPDLNISDISTNQAGTYTVVAAGFSGTNVTASATLTVIQGTIVNFQISGYADGSSSNILIELFDQDKPATVENFVHYINSGAYSNMIIDRLLPGFVLQTGDYDSATNRTDTTPPFQVFPISDFVGPNGGELGIALPYLPEQIDNEYNVGPIVSNTAGTIAMALQSGNSNSATSAFFFNLVDNPFLDGTATGGGPFVVFGRVLSGTNILQYFNNPNVFSKPSFTTNPTTNIFTNGIFDETFLTTDPVITDLPVNFHGTNIPAPANLFYVNLSFPDSSALPVIDTNPPTGLTIAFPGANAVLTNGYEFTVQGTAQDSVGLAFVYTTLAAQNGPEADQPFGGFDYGTVNWSVPVGALPPGIYQLLQTYQNAAGYDGNPVSEYFTVSAVIINGNGSVTVEDARTHASLGNAVGAPLQDGTNYIFTAQPEPGQFFFDWVYGTNVSTNLVITNHMSDGMVYTATFTSGASQIEVTNPAPGLNPTNGNFDLQGTVGSLFLPPVTVSCRLYSGNRQEIGAVFHVSTANSWSFPITNFTARGASLAAGSYYAVLTAVDAAGRTAVLTNDFGVGLPITLATAGNGHGTFSSLTNGQFLAPGQQYTLTAKPAPGSLFDAWLYNGDDYIGTPGISFAMQPGITLTAIFVSNDVPANISQPILITNPAANNVQLTTQSFTLGGTINSALVNPVMSYQLFLNSNAELPLRSNNVTITPGSGRSAWSVPLNNLEPGLYTAVASVTDASNRTTLVSRSFEILAQVTFQVLPPGAGKFTSNWSGSYLSTTKAYAATAKTNGGYVFAFWSNSVAGNVSVNPLAFRPFGNTTYTAYFATNPFYAVAGTYNGLFYPLGTNLFTPIDSALSPTNSGFYTLTVNQFGSLTLALQFPALKLTSTGFFPLYNTNQFATAAFAWKGLDGKQVTNHVNLDLTPGGDFLTGDVANAKFSSYLLAFRGLTNVNATGLSTAGTNVMFIPGDPSATVHPGGDSYATFTLGNNGAINLIGSLADGSSFSQNPLLTFTDVTTNTFWPLYAPLYSGKGFIMGWVSNTTSTTMEGLLTWSKPAKNGTYYTNSFLWYTNAFTTPHTPPAANDQYEISFGGASLGNVTIANTVTVGNNGLFTVNAGQTNHLVLTLTPKTGVLTGSFSYPRGTVTYKLYGAFANPAQGGSGYFLGTDNQSGYFDLTPIVATPEPAGNGDDGSVSTTINPPPTEIDAGQGGSSNGGGDE